MLKFTRLAAAAAAIAFAAPQDARALTISLDFVTSLTTDIFGSTTNADNLSTFGFTTLTTAQAQSAIYDAVVADYLGFPTVASNGSSPIPAGMMLNLNFVLSTNTVTPVHVGNEYFHVAIGTGDTSPASGALGQACVACVRTSSGAHGGAPDGAIVGSIFTNFIDDLVGLASNDTQRINLIAGTVSHEIGHSLSLLHTSQEANPGASLWPLMGTGAIDMPNIERIKDRAFSYIEMTQLVSAVGLTDAPAAVPEPASMVLLVSGVLLLRLRRRA